MSSLETYAQSDNTVAMRGININRSDYNMLILSRSHERNSHYPALQLRYFQEICLHAAFFAVMRRIVQIIGALQTYSKLAIFCFLTCGVSNFSNAIFIQDSIRNELSNHPLKIPRIAIKAMDNIIPIQQRYSRSTANNTALFLNDDPNSNIHPLVITSVTTSSKQDQCLLDGVLVERSSVFCENIVGCRAIQKTGQCCPNYICDCQKDGKTYSNGDKLVDRNSPCIVCYCQGGEINCSTVTCFYRDDCTPIYKPGLCCPEYNSCPLPSTNFANKITNDKSANSTATALNSQITIKEITKPTEIRITVNNTIPILQILKPTVSSIKLSTTNATLETQKSLTSTTIKNVQPSMDSNQYSTEIPPAESLKLVTSVAYTSAELSQQTQNIALSQSSLKFEDKHAFLAPKLNDHHISVDGIAKSDIKREFSTSTDMRIDQVELILGSPSEQFESISKNYNSFFPEPDTSGSDNIYRIVLTTERPKMANTSNNYISTKKYLNRTAGIIPDIHDNFPAKVGSIINLTDELNISLFFDSKNDTLNLKLNTPVIEFTQIYVTEQNFNNSNITDEEDTSVTIENNPAYPFIEDDFSLRDVNFPLSETDDSLDVYNKNDLRTIERSVQSNANNQKQKMSLLKIEGSGMEASLPTLSNSKIIKSINSNSSNGTTTINALLINGNTTQSFRNIQSNIDIFNSMENSSAELKNQNETFFKTDHLLKVNNHLQKQVINNRERELTTSKPTLYSFKWDIDEIEEASGHYDLLTSDPKDDAESLKLDDQTNTGIQTVMNTDIIASKKLKGTEVIS